MKTTNFKKRIFSGKFFLVGILTLMFAVTSCNKDEDFVEAPEPEFGLPDIEKTLEKISEDSTYLYQLAEQGELKSGWSWRKAPTFFNLTYALAKTRLLSTVLIKDLTVFAPTDDAFRQLFKDLGVKNISQLSASQLKPILLYHVVQGRVRSSDLTNGFVVTLNGAAVKIDLSDGVKVNDANVIFTDLRTLNGLIHAIDRVLLPPSKNLVEVALSIPDFSILVDAVVAAGLAETLATGGPFTVFAPTNTAFANLLTELGFADLNALVGTIGISGLQSVLLYHVINGRVYSSDLPLGPLSVSALNSQSFTIDVTIPGITDATGRKSGLVPALLDVQASNGVIHVIDKVILPVL